MIARALRNVILGSLCLLSAVSRTSAESRPEIKFLKPVEISSIGLRLNMMPEAREVAAPPPQVFHYTRSQGDKKWSMDMYSPSELWRASQYAGKWVDQRSNTLTLAALSAVFPADKFTKQHVPREEYDKIIKEANINPIEWNDENISNWIEAFTGQQDPPAHNVPKAPAHLKNVKAFSLPDNSFAYVFCINRHPVAGTVSVTSTWYFAMFNLNPKVDQEKAQKTINDVFLRSLAAGKIINKQVAASTSFQSTSFAGKKQRSPEFMASRQQVSDSIKNMKDWWYAETDNYIFLSNMKSQHKVVIKDLQERIEYLRDAFEQFMPPRKPITAISVVRAFATSEAYSEYVGKDHVWSAGLWTPMRKELVIRPMEGAGAKYQREAFHKIVFHEAFHQYIFYAFDQKSPAIWFNEGHAEFYSSATINERKFAICENSPGAIKVIDDMMAAKAVDINKLIHMSQEEFYAGSNETRQKNYALAWALVYYLRKSAPLETPPKYAKILDKYADELWESGNAEKATEVAFEGIDVGALQRDFILFWTSQKKRGAALRNNIFKAYNPALKK